MQGMFPIYLKISTLKKGFLKEMEVISIKDILSCEEFPIVLIRSYEIDSFIIGYHVYKKKLGSSCWRRINWCYGIK